MTARQRWVVATGNAGKLAEIRQLLDGTELELLAQGELGIEGAEETATSFVENALIKARHAALSTKLPAIADDSGLSVDALGGAPGVWSARYAGPGADSARNVAKLLDALKAVPADQRTARFHCVTVAMRGPDDPVPRIFHGSWAGLIAEQARGRHGFGYDPIFVDSRLGKTAAELPSATKNEISHRAAALKKLAEWLRETP